MTFSWARCRLDSRSPADTGRQGRGRTVSEADGSSIRQGTGSPVTQCSTHAHHRSQCRGYVAENYGCNVLESRVHITKTRPMCISIGSFHDCLMPIDVTTVFNFWRKWVDNTIKRNFYFHPQEEKKQYFCHLQETKLSTAYCRQYCLVVIAAFGICLSLE